MMVFASLVALLIAFFAGFWLCNRTLAATITNLIHENDSLLDENIRLLGETYYKAVRADVKPKLADGLPQEYSQSGSDLE